ANVELVPIRDAVLLQALAGHRLVLDEGVVVPGAAEPARRCGEDHLAPRLPPARIGPARPHVLRRPQEGPGLTGGPPVAGGPRRARRARLRPARSVLRCGGARRIPFVPGLGAAGAPGLPRLRRRGLAGRRLRKPRRVVAVACRLALVSLVATSGAPPESGHP